MHRAVVNFAAGRLDAQHDPGLSLEQIEKAVRDAGYGVESAQETERSPFWRTPRAVSVFASALLFVTGLALGLAGAPEVASVAAYLAAIAVGGVPIFRAALAGLRAKHLDMNVLMTAATVGAVAIGEWAEAASVVVLFAAGNALQVYAIDRTRGAVRALARLAPDEVLVRRGGSETLVPAVEVAVGETVVVRPGERLALDAEVAEGETTVDESPVTGESTPVEKGPGDSVYSGSLNGGGGVLVRVLREASDSTLQRIARLVEEAQATKAPAEQFVDRFSRLYTPIVVAAAIVLAVVPPLLGGEFGTWFYRALALLIIACPCALVISTPVTVVSGIGAAQGIGLRQDGYPHRRPPGALARRGARRARRDGGAGACGSARAPLGTPPGARHLECRGRGRFAAGLGLPLGLGQGCRGRGEQGPVPDREPPAVRREADRPRRRDQGAGGCRGRGRDASCLGERRSDSRRFRDRGCSAP
jgi:Cd2+/Zn2+-exporting ATPase